MKTMIWVLKNLRKRATMLKLDDGTKDFIANWVLIISPDLIPYLKV